MTEQTCKACGEKQPLGLPGIFGAIIVRGPSKGMTVYHAMLLNQGFITREQALAQVMEVPPKTQTDE